MDCDDVDDMGWIHIAQNREKWWAFGKTKINFWIK
jgi:hypothetical protein